MSSIVEHRTRAAQWRESQRRRRERQRELGLCRECDSPAGPVSRDTCEVHRAARNERLARHWSRRLGR